MICYSVYRTREILHMFFLQEMIIKIQGVINVIQHKGSCTLVQRCFLFGDNGIEQRSCKSKSWTVRNITLWQQQISPSLSCWCWLPFIEIRSKSLFYKNTANHGSPFKKRFFNCPIKSRDQILIYERQHDWIDTLKPAWTRGLLMTSITLVSMILDASEREDLWHPG